MIPGVVSSAGVPPYDPLASAYLVMDFQNSVYKIAGTSVTAADVIDHPELITSYGLRVDWNATTQFAINILSTAVAAIDFSVGCTVVIDFDQFDTGGSLYNQTMLEFWQGVPYSEPFDVVFSLYGGGAQIKPYCATSATSNRGFTVYHSLPDGSSRKYGMTSTPDRLSFSHNGGAVVTDTSGTTGVTPTFDSYTIGTYGSAFDINALYRSIIFYPPIADVNLPSYTALA